MLAAELVGCEGVDFEGLSLGELFTSWPEEVRSGRVGNSRRRTPTSRVVKAYIKLVQAADDLETVLRQGMADGAFGTRDGTEITIGNSGRRAPSRRASSRGAASASRVTFSAGRPSSAVVSLPKLRVSATSPADAVLRAASGPAVQQPAALAPSMSRSQLPSGQSDAASAHLPQPAVDPSHAQFDASTLTRVRRARSVNELAQALQSGVFQPQVHADHTPRRWLAWLIGVLVTLAVPKVVLRLMAICVELALTYSFGGVARVAVATQEEVGHAGTRFLAFVERVCFDDEGFTPVPPPAAVSRAASTVAASQMQGNLTADQVVTVIQEAVHAASSQQVQSRFPAFGDWLNQFGPPSWVFVLVGFVTASWSH